MLITIRTLFVTHGWAQLCGYLPGIGHNSVDSYRGLGPAVWITTGEWDSCLETYHGVVTVVWIPTGEWAQLFGYLPGSGPSCVDTYRGVAQLYGYLPGSGHSPCSSRVSGSGHSAV